MIDIAQWRVHIGCYYGIMHCGQLSSGEQHLNISFTYIMLSVVLLLCGTGPFILGNNKKYKTIV